MTAPKTTHVWPVLEKAARVWAKAKGIDPDDFVSWLKEEVKKGRVRGTPKQTDWAAYAERSQPKEE